MGNKQSNDADIEPDPKEMKSQHVKDKLKIKSIQKLFSSFYLTIQETLSNMNQQKEQADFVQLKNIDLCQALKGTIFNTMLNKLCDIKEIICNIQIGFTSLQCDHCDHQASIACEGNQETPYKLYCEGHFEVLGSHFKSSIILMHDLRYNTIMLNELEGHLIRLQERIEYFNIQNVKKNPYLLTKVKGLIDDNFGELNTLLESLTSKCNRIKQLNTKTISSNTKMKYEYLTFIKDDCDKCRNTIFKILSMIPEVCDKIETDSLIQVIVDENKGVPFEEESKENLTSSIPDNIYGKEYQLVHIPTQSLVQFKKFENKIKINCQIIETCVEKVKSMMDTAESLNKMLEDKLDQTEIKIAKDKEKVLKQLSLRDAQFYIDRLKIESDRAEIFKKDFTIKSGVYKRLGQFDYGQPNCTTDHIKTYIHEQDILGWIYIGEVKEGTDDTPHGIGIKVYDNGGIEEGYWKDEELHGRGRRIHLYSESYVGEFKGGMYNGKGISYDENCDKQYEGEWKGGIYNGQGTYYNFNGDKYTGIWNWNEGQGEINYEDGSKYIGEWDWLNKHGLGTLYSADGQVLNQGKWDWDKYKGEE